METAIEICRGRDAGECPAYGGCLYYAASQLLYDVFAVHHLVTANIHVVDPCFTYDWLHPADDLASHDTRQSPEEQDVADNLVKQEGTKGLYCTPRNT